MQSRDAHPIFPMVEAQPRPPALHQSFVSGTAETPAGAIPTVSSRLTRSDRWGSFKARWAIGRMRFSVEPGLYALGVPDAESHALVTANYKMSFDRLRAAMDGRSAWILVLDTQGINVWCAAGKGTFGTEELVGRIRSSRLPDILKHRTLILPQLAGPGIAAHEVHHKAGFRVLYGPVDARDLPAFLDGGMSASPDMRRKRFRIGERIALIPVETVAALKWVGALSVVVLALAGLPQVSAFWTGAWRYGLPLVTILWGALLAGAVLTPILLPWLPGRAFSLKGAVMGLMVSAGVGAAWLANRPFRPGIAELCSWALVGSALSAYFAMNFTGASSYTSLSGVKKEMRRSLPFQIGAAVIGLCLWAAARLNQ